VRRLGRVGQALAAKAFHELGGQMPSEHDTCTHQSDPQGNRCSAELLGDLVEGQPFIEPQFDQCSVTCVQPLQAFTEELEGAWVLVEELGEERWDGDLGQRGCVDQLRIAASRP